MTTPPPHWSITTTASAFARTWTPRWSSRRQRAPARRRTGCRMVNTLAAGRARIGEIVAVTFTEKAAGS